MMPLRLHVEASEEMRQAAAYYEDQQEGLGEEFLGELKQAAARIQRMPNAWPFVSARSRRCQLSRFPYGLIYTVLEEQEILVLAVMHLRRQPNYWRKRGAVKPGFSRDRRVPLRQPEGCTPNGLRTRRAPAPLRAQGLAMLPELEGQSRPAHFAF